VFDAIVQSGLKLFSGAVVLITLPDGDKVKGAAVAASDPARAEAIMRRLPYSLTREGVLGKRLARYGLTLHPDKTRFID
jgi:hypothetical protein